MYERVGDREHVAISAHDFHIAGKYELSEIRRRMPDPVSTRLCLILLLRSIHHLSYLISSYNDDRCAATRQHFLSHNSPP
jgi:hypothetical protein